MNNLSHRHNQKEQTILRKTLRNNATAPEAILWLRLKGKQVEGLKFRRQFGIGPYVLDFYCPQLRLAIELDGKVHDTFWAETHDNIRTKFLSENNMTILRFKNEIVYHNIEAIVEEIKRYKTQYEYNSSPESGEVRRGLNEGNSTLVQTTPNPS